MKSRLLLASAMALLVPAMAATGAAHAADKVVRVLRAETNEVEKKVYAQAEADFEAENPDVDVQIEYLANEAYKQKLPTLLQSDAKPDLFYSWGGGVLRDQVEAGFVGDVTEEVKNDWAKTYSPAGINAFTVDGKIVGVPINAIEVVFWTNLELAEKAGIDIDTIKTWDDFLAAVEKAKEAGITPIIVGGQDKWPLHFYYGYLAVRAAGADGFEAALKGEGDGFASEDFVRAGKEFQRLVELKPFQPGFMSTTYEQASGRFGDGEAVFNLMGDWEYQSSRDRSLDGKGVEDDQLGLLRFPALEGGKGEATDTFGGINGWVVTKGASPEAVEFLRHIEAPKYQGLNAAGGVYIPTAKGASESLGNPYFKTIAEALADSKFHQIFLDQDLGADVGATFNDASADLAQGAITPEEAAKMVQEAWSFQ